MTMALARSASGATPTRPSLTGRAAIVAAVGVPCSALILIAGTPQNVVLADQVPGRTGRRPCEDSGAHRITNQLMKHDHLRFRQKRKTWSFTILRPEAVWGYAVGNQ